MAANSTDLFDSQTGVKPPNNLTQQAAAQGAAAQSTTPPSPQPTYSVQGGQPGTGVGGLAGAPAPTAMQPIAISDPIEQFAPTSLTNQAAAQGTSAQTTGTASPAIPNFDMSVAPTPTPWTPPFDTTAPKVDPLASTVDKSTETVQGQLQNLFAEGSPLLVQAREQAAAQAAGRGLQNSSLAAGAGEQALFSSAMPIAQQDAATYSQRAMLNNQTANQFLMNEQTFGQKLAEIAQSGNIQSGLAAQMSHERIAEMIAQGNINAGLSDQEFQQKMGMSREEYAQRVQLATQEHNQRLEELRTSGDITAYLDSLKAGYETDLTVLRGQIAHEAQVLDAANRLIEQAAQGDINSRLQMEQFGFQAELSAQENVQRLEQLALQGDINAKLQLEQFTYQTLLNDQQNGVAIQLEDMRIQGTQNAILLEYEQRGILSAQESQAEMDRLNQQHQNTMEQIAQQAASASTTDAAQAARAIQSQYLTAVAARQGAASAEIAQIYQTEGLKSSQQQAAVQNAYSRLQADLDMLASYYQSMPVWPTGVSTTGTAPPPGGTLPNTQSPAPYASYPQQNYATNMTPGELALSEALSNNTHTGWVNYAR